jgi:hypothetical protein
MNWGQLESVFGTELKKHVNFIDLSVNLVFVVSFNSSELTALLVKCFAHDRHRNFDWPKNKIGLLFLSRFEV